MVTLILELYFYIWYQNLPSVEISALYKISKYHVRFIFLSLIFVFLFQSSIYKSHLQKLFFLVVLGTCVRYLVLFTIKYYLYIDFCLA